MAPIFPSLIEEGKSGGGYDVKLDFPGLALFLQFKRADRMTMKSAKEIKNSGAPLSLPYHRFSITQAGKSDQHELLLALDDGTGLVFYAAPRFHLLSEINDAWSANQVASQSIFVAPSDIGTLDELSHVVAYDSVGAWLCSVPRTVNGLNSVDVFEKLRSRLSFDKLPLREKIPQLVELLERSQQQARSRTSEREAARVRFRDYGLEPLSVRTTVEQKALPSVPTRSARAVDGPAAALRGIADTAARIFDAQLVIVQPSA